MTTQNNTAAVPQPDGVSNDRERSAIASLITGIISSFLYIINTVFWVPLLVFSALLKLAIPIGVWRKLCSRIINWIATTWISFNNWNMQVTKDIRLEVDGLDTVKRDEWYLVISNHQSWADILILQRIFNHKIPFLKFFLKKELIWVPLMGIAWWALDFPFMKRYSEAFLKKYPHLKGKDIQITRKACEKFKHIPVSVMNFVEGTRFTPEKHDRQQSPFDNLLRPKAGGIAFVLSTMGDSIHSILNVSISYSQGIRNFWDFLCGKVKSVKVHVEEIPITGNLLGDYQEDAAFREHFQAWLNTVWEEKYIRLKKMSAES